MKKTNSWGSEKNGLASLLIQKSYRAFDGAEELPSLCLELLSDQKQTWPDLRKGYEALKKIEERNLPCHGFVVRLQHNPMRIKSSTADPIRTRASDRSCFLCLKNLPEHQKGTLYRNAYLILCNPMPVFSPHFTVSHLEHRPQAIEEHIPHFLQLMVDFHPGWTILYNGPKCGASAPDHLHFQVVPSGKMPIEREVQKKERLCLIKEMKRVLLFRVQDLGRAVILLEGDDPMAVGQVLRDFVKRLREVLSTEEEPMLNLAGLYKGGKCRLVIFPRRKHRPEVFFRSGQAKRLISPGVIDMGGLLITPLKKDYERLDATTVESIYREVSLEGGMVEKAARALR